MAGVHVVRSYEWWDQAAATQKMNIGESSVVKNIRELDLSELPDSIDIVVGSPPCTQFSYSNRGGGGDIADGLKDVRKFLEIVRHVNPRYWVMENVPRVASILEKELGETGLLQEFSYLVKDIRVVDCSDFGLPQRRKRMLAGNFPVELLESYKSSKPTRTLGDVINAFDSEQIVDPIYGFDMDTEMIVDHIKEAPLNEEEARINSDSKQFHRIYNVMQFPDSKGRTARTVTAAETRVSRESLIVQDNGTVFRRLTLREKATLQGFPLTFQYFGKSYSDRQKMIGNAIPPLLTYYIGQALKHTPVGLENEDLENYPHSTPREASIPVVPRISSGSFRAQRRFRSAIPNFRFGSGVRFELSNEFDDSEVSWLSSFYIGTSKRYVQVVPDVDMSQFLLAQIDAPFRGAIEKYRHQVTELSEIDSKELQKAWNHSSNESISPFAVIDELGAISQQVFSGLGIENEHVSYSGVLSAILDKCVGRSESDMGRKFPTIYTKVAIGLITTGWYNG